MEIGPEYSLLDKVSGIYDSLSLKVGSIFRLFWLSFKEIRDFYY